MMPKTSRLATPLLILTIILVVSALINPRFLVNSGPVDVVVLWDQSLSVDSEAQQKAWQELRTEIASLPQTSQVALIHFAGNSQLDNNVQLSNSAIKTGRFSSSSAPQQESLYTAGTNIEAALKDAIKLSVDQNKTRILLVTDGAETQGNAVALLENTAIQVTALRLPLSPKTAQNRILQIAAPHQVNRGIPFRIDIEMQGNIGSESNLSCRLNQALISSNIVTFPLTQQFVSITAQLTESGLNELRCILKDVHNEDEYALLINAISPRPNLLYLYGQRASTQLAKQLDTMNLEVDLHSASQFDEIKQLQSYDLMIFDNLSFDDLSLSNWHKISRAVSSQGKGLLVIAGDRSFSNGAYRGSLLEDLLPLKLETPKTEQAIAVQFLIDRSGSMATDGSGDSPLFHAKQAVLGAIRILENHDQLGILSFAANINILAPMQTANQVRTVDIVNSIASQGGTRLYPALVQAKAALSELDVSDKFLFLITDSKFSQDDTDRSVELLRHSKLRIIVFHVGNNINSNLSALTELANVKHLNISDIGDLPRIVRKQVEQIKSPQITTPTYPLAKQQLLGPNDASWPVVDSHYVTTAKTTTQPLLVSQEGTPLLALHQQGLGRVAATTFALKPWYDQANWAQRQSLLPTIIDLISPQPLNNWHLRLDLSDGRPVLKAESINGETPTTPLTASITVNKRPLTTIVLEESLPNLYEAQIPQLPAGTLAATLSLDGKQIRHHFFIGEQREWRARGDRFWNQLKKSGRVDVQTLNDDLHIPRAQTEFHTRPLLLVIALFVYCLAMALRLDVFKRIRS